MREATKAHKMVKESEQRQIFTAACLFWKARGSKKVRRTVKIPVLF